MVCRVEPDCRTWFRLCSIAGVRELAASRFCAARVRGGAASVWKLDRGREHSRAAGQPERPTAGVPFKVKTSARGYLLEAFLPAAVLHGYDPEQNRRLGLYYAVHDNELGEQVLSVGADFPYWEDPSLWSVLELMR